MVLDRAARWGCVTLSAVSRHDRMGRLKRNKASRDRNTEMASKELAIGEAFKQRVPELRSGAVEILDIAREPNVATKIIVSTTFVDDEFAPLIPAIKEIFDVEKENDGVVSVGHDG